MKQAEREEFIKELAERFYDSRAAEGLASVQIPERDAIKIKEKSGDPDLHFEVCFKKGPRPLVEIAFHEHLKDPKLKARKARINKVMVEAKEELKESGARFRYDPDWRKYWARFYTLYTPVSLSDVRPVLERLCSLVEVFKPKLDAIKWGRV